MDLLERMNKSELPSLIHAYFHFQVNRVPDVVALRHGQTNVTFDDLDKDSARLASALAARGVKAGSYIGVHMERSADYVTCILGILKANAAVVPLPPSYPTERLRNILAFAEPDLVIGSRANPIDQSVGVYALSLDELLAEDAPAVTFDPGSPTQAAFVLCSSGSTGHSEDDRAEPRFFFSPSAVDLARASFRRRRRGLPKSKHDDDA